jgi:hypothetical protein
MLAVAIKTQKAVPGAVPTGGSIAAFYAGHRLSYDLDHLLQNLQGEFAEVVEHLDGVEGWKSARRTTGKVILGSLDGIEVGLRQIRRTKPMKTITIRTSNGEWTIPTYGEALNEKAAMVAVRGATRDFLDVIALVRAAKDRRAVIDNLLRLDEDFEGLQQHSILLSVAQHLCHPEPADLHSMDLSNYKGLSGDLTSWSVIRDECIQLGQELTRRIAIEAIKK